MEQTFGLTQKAQASKFFHKKEDGQNTVAQE